MSSPSVIGSKGPIQLGASLAGGGEGTVFEVTGRKDLVAKIYHKPADRERSEKLAAMQTILTPALSSLTAWPTEILRNTKGETAGFLMPNLSGSKDIHTLYSPKSRLTEFPSADWRMLVRAALNTARAFAVLHQSNCLVGDVNFGGVRVAHDATVRLIDCDSFQIQKDGRLFLCQVGVDTFTPPELQGKEFKVTPRTPNHDNFGLAVLIFQILMMGRHPFAGRFFRSDDMPIDKAIGEFRYAYSRDTRTTGMQPPPHTAAVSTASAEVANLWEAAFSKQGAQVGRPTAAQWVHALSSLESKFVRCANNPSHYFLSGQSQCPWCPIEKVGVALFGFSAGPQQISSGGVNVEVLWNQIKAIRPLGFAGPVPSVPLPTPSQRATAVGLRRKKWRVTASLMALTIIILGFALNLDLAILWVIAGVITGLIVASRGSTDVGVFQEEKRKAQTAMDALVARWKSEGDGSSVDKKLGELYKLGEEWAQLPAQRQKKYAELLANREKYAREKFLDSFEIERATIPKIGNAKKATLASYGIETAADITWSKVINVPGFGDALTRRLLAWRQSIERQFRFNPQASLDPRQVADLDQVIGARRGYLEKELRQGAAQLQTLKTSVLQRRQVLEPQLREAAARLAQATSDLNAVS